MCVSVCASHFVLSVQVTLLRILLNVLSVVPPGVSNFSYASWQWELNRNGPMQQILGKYM